MRIGGPNNNSNVGFHKEIVVNAPKQQQQPTPLQPNANNQFGAFQGNAAPNSQGVIPGAQGTARSLMGVTNNPAALLQQVSAEAQMGAQIQQMSQFAMQAMQAMGLGGMPQMQQMAMINSIGQRMVQHAQSMAPAAMMQQIFQSMGPKCHQIMGKQLMNFGMNQPALEQWGAKALNYFAQKPDVHWGRQTLGNIGPQFFQNFDPRSLAAMPDAGLAQFSSQLMNMARAMSPQQIGQQMVSSLTPQMLQQISQGILPQIPAPAMADMGQMMQQAMAADPMGMGQQLLQNLGLDKLKSMGQQLLGNLGKNFSNLPNIGKELANNFHKLLGDFKAQGQQYLKGLIDYGKNKIIDFAKKGLGSLGQKLLSKLPGGFLQKIGGKALSALQGGIGKVAGKFLDKIGGKLLSKLGGAGGIIGGALSLLNGKFDANKAIKLALNFIPGVGPILGALSSIPGVGKVIDKGINLVKNVGKKILGGVKKLFSKI